jgi:hypothetical protein
MGNIRLYGSTSGYTELAPPAVAPDGVLSLPSGVGTLLTAEGGKVLQVVGALTATGTTTTSTTFVNTDLSVNITPQFATSKILIFNFNQGLQFTNAAGETIIEIARNTTSISALTNVYSTTTQTLVMPASIGVLDSPSTTSAITYRTRIRTANSSNSAAINGQQHLIAIEVSA